MGSRSRLGSATGLRYQELLGDLEKGNWQTLTKSEFQGVYLEICLQLTKLSSMDSVMPAKELMGQLFTFVLRTRLATESPI